DVAGAEGPVADFGVGLDPGQPPALFAPKAVGILDRTLIQRPVFGIVDVGPLGPVGRDVVDLLGHGAPSTQLSSLNRAAAVRVVISRKPLAALCDAAGARDKQVRLALLVPITRRSRR